MTFVSRRQLATGAAALCLAGASSLRAQDAYPQRPVKLIVPYAPGGGTDVFSRLLAAQMEKEFGQPLVIDNRAGGASTIGTRAVADAAGDGYTIGMVDSAFVTNPGLLGEKLPYDTRKDFIPVSLLSRTQLVLAVPAASPFKTAKELVDYAKANPGKLTFASAGIGTGIHLAGEQFRQVAGIQIVIVPYRGGAPALADFLAGKVDFTFGAVPSIKSYIEAGNARGLGVTRGRAPQLPGIPGMDEIGYGSVDSASEMGLVVPASTPAPIVEKLQRISATTVKDAVFREKLLARGFQPIGTSTDEFRSHVDREIDKWVKIIAAGNIKPE
ncbi:Bug family tripartite tricarboxylate transporter substrate binding protein [Rhodoplanes sp. Z2-YC6860]|uniref:Bug family tripartite tricarboxylate transporter substrate binding protein n=1 Tax=Rhodoplanes sp. Z2-YC6860 TaxID=674703 RepID=UPI00078EA9C8|nr:tripartite tricarboxylate transporter substrate binding protein [Rhodoplanes sp. Z2-YC6860]AMN42005.1 Tat pathway signal sequence domain protein [Rhodoplanes sp. Z2-YC6860]